MSRSVAISVIVFVVGFALGRVSVLNGGAASPASVTMTPTGTPAMPAMPASAKSGVNDVRPGGQLHGKVAEVLQVPQYTYLRMESGEWAAVDSAPSMTVGQEATVNLQNEMADFPSPSLNRTFAKLWFGTLEGAAPVARTPAPGAMPGAGAPTGAPMGEARPMAKVADTGPALTLRVVDVYTEKAALNGKKVKIKGTVDRVNVVQGVAYVHLKDGSGDATAKTDDLLCIASGEVTKGQSVTAEGVIAVDKNVGMGPVPVALDEATLR
jgi:hypothetical protein